MKKLIILLCCVLILTNCENKKQMHSSQARILQINPKKKERLRYSEVFDTYETIFLDPSNDFLIDKIKQVKYFQKKIFVLDRTHKLFVFSDTGDGLTIIDKRGVGANEYIDIRGFDIDRERNELVVNTFPSKIMRFTFEGELVSETKLSIKGTDIAVIGNNEMALYTQNLINQHDKQNHNLFILSDHNVQAYKGCKLSSMAKGGMLIEFQYMGVFSRFNENNETLFAHPFSNKILSLKESKQPTIKYEIKCDGISFINLSEDNIKSYQELKAHMDGNKYAYGINSYWENSSWINFSINIKGEFFNRIFDKQDSSYKSCIFEDDLLGIRPTPINTTDEYQICFTDAENLFSISEYLSISGKDPTPEIKILLDTVEETGNPVILKFYFKK